MLKMREVFILKTFPCGMDGIGAITKVLQKETMADVPASIAEGLKKEGLIQYNAPSGWKAKEKKEVEPPAPNTPEPPAPEEYSKEYFMAMKEDALVLFLKDSEEELTGSETQEQLAELCAELMSEDEDDK